MIMNFVLKLNVRIRIVRYDMPKGTQQGKLHTKVKNRIK